MTDEFRFFPVQASAGAAEVDAVYFFLCAVSAFFTVLIFVLIVYFALHYRQGRNVDRTHPGHERWWVEISWAIVPLILVMIMFGWGAAIFVKGSEVPENSLVIDVVGKQWMWRVFHREGKQEINTLHVPLGRPVRLRMISDDVIHSFYVPAFRRKMDVLPGRHTELWFEATRPGVYHLFCAEYCGAEHAYMRGAVVVMEPGDFAKWIRGAGDDPPEVIGERLFTQFRCDNCHHSNPGARCPPLGGLYGSTVMLQDGTTVTADEAYLRESILNSAAKIVAGYKSDMPLYRGQMSEEDALHLVAYIRSLRAPDAAPKEQ